MTTQQLSNSRSSRTASHHAPAFSRWMRGLAAASLSLSLLACQKSDWGEKAPFTAEPAPESWTRPKADPAASAAAKNQVERLWGTDTYPCTGHSSCDRKTPPDGTLGVSVGGFEFLDPSRLSESEGIFIGMNLFEGLINPARKSGEPLQAGVAERWTVSEDGRIYTFYLRENAKWSNGRAVTAEDFVYSWRRRLDPATGSDSIDAMLYLENAKEFNEGKLKDPSLLGVKALDERTLQVTLRCSVPYWPSYLVGAAYLPVPREAIEQHDRFWTRPENIITNGAYKLIELKERDRVILEKSEHYWDKDNVRIPRVIAYHAEKEESGLALYESGTIQYARGAVSPNMTVAAMSEKRPDLVIDPILCTYYYLFRLDKPELQDIRIRKAIDLAIDKEKLVKHVTRSGQLAATGIVPAFFEPEGYKSAKLPSHNIDEAKRLLAEAGYPNGKGLPPIQLIYNTMESHKAVAEFVGAQLQENLGLQISIENMEWKSLLQRMRLGDFHMMRMGLCSNDTPISFLESFKSDSSRNVMKFNSPEFDSTFEQASCGSTNQDDYFKHTAEAERIALEGYALIPLYWYTRPYLRNPVLGGLEVHLQDYHLMQHLWWRDTQTPPEPRDIAAPERVPNLAPSPVKAEEAPAAPEAPADAQGEGDAAQ